jgi:hypothetical protein
MPVLELNPGGNQFAAELRVNKISANSQAIGTLWPAQRRNIPKEPWTPAEIAGGREFARLRQGSAGPAFARFLNRLFTGIPKGSTHSTGIGPADSPVEASR